MSDVYGGLLDVSLHPGFKDNRLVYIAYDDAAFGLAVARFEFRDDGAHSLDVIYESNEFSIGSRIAWEDASHFFLSFGVGGSPYPQPCPRDLSSDVGKIHRLMAPVVRQVAVLECILEIADRDPRAGRRQRAGDRAPEPARPAGDHGGPAVQEARRASARSDHWCSPIQPHRARPV